MSKWEESKFKAFLDRSKDVLVKNGGDVLGIGLKFATGNVTGALSDVSGLLSGDGDTLTKELKQEFELRKREFELESFKLSVQDRESARTREVDVIKAGGSDIMMTVVGSVGLLCLVLFVIAVLFFDIPPNNKTEFNLLLGWVGGVITSIFAYYFGSSKGSKDKHDAMAKKGV